MSSIPVYQTIDQYNKAINISPPRHPGIDIRRFEDNMVSVPLTMPMFRHGFFQIALLNSGDGDVQRDAVIEQFENYTLFLTVPGQLLSWNIRRNWKGLYTSFTEDYILLKRQNQNFLRHFPFLLRSAPAVLRLQPTEAGSVLELFEKLYHEHLAPSHYSKSIVESYLNIFLEYTHQFYDRYRNLQTRKRKNSNLYRIL